MKTSRFVFKSIECWFQLGPSTRLQFTCVTCPPASCSPVCTSALCNQRALGVHFQYRIEEKFWWQEEIAFIHLDGCLLCARCSVRPRISVPQGQAFCFFLSLLYLNNWPSIWHRWRAGIFIGWMEGGMMYWSESYQQRDDTFSLV